MTDSDPGRGCIVIVGGILIVMMLALAVGGAILRIKGYTP